MERGLTSSVFSFMQREHKDSAMRKTSSDLRNRPEEGMKRLFSSGGNIMWHDGYRGQLKSALPV